MTNKERFMVAQIAGGICILIAIFTQSLLMAVWGIVFLLLAFYFASY